MDAPPQAAQAPKQGLFGSHPVAQAFDPTEIQSDVNAVSTRLRIGEERFNDLRRQLQFIEQQSLTNHKKVMSEVKMLNGEVTDMKRAISEIQNRMILLIKELQLMAKKTDMDVLRKYIDLWEPVKFVGVQEVEKIVKEKLEDAARAGKAESQE